MCGQNLKRIKNKWICAPTVYAKLALAPRLTVCGRARLPLASPVTVCANLDSYLPLSGLRHEAESEYKKNLLSE